MSAIGLKIPLRSRHVLPGFSLSLGFTLFYLTGIVLIPLLALVIRPFELGWGGFWAAITTPRVLASLRLSFGMALFAALLFYRGLQARRHRLSRMRAVAVARRCRGTRSGR